MDMRLIYLCIYVAEGITAWSYFSGMFRRRCTLLVSVRHML